MKRLYFASRGVGVGAAAILLAGCSPGLESDVRRLKASIEDLRSLNAEQNSRLTSLSQEVRELHGKMEELEFAQKRRIGGEVDDIKSQLSRLKSRVPPPAIVPADYLDSDEQSAQQLPEALRDRVINGLQHIREGSFAEAVPVLQAALDASAGTPPGAPILYWLGVAYDGLNDNRNALVAYSQIVTVYSSSTIVPRALLRQAAVFKRLGDSKAELATLRKLSADFPDSPESALAQKILKKS